MDIGAIVTGALGSVFAGGALGAVGALGNGVLNFYKQKQANAHELAVLESQLVNIKAMGSSEAALAALKMVGESYNADKATYQDAKGIDVYRGSVRPTITYMLTIMSCTIAGYCLYKVGIEMDTIKELADFSVRMCLNTTGVVVVWWFGGRGNSEISTRRK